MPFELNLTCNHCGEEITAIVSNISRENIACLHCGEIFFCKDTQFNARFIPGYIYILSNTHMPDLLKIGITTRTVPERVAELNSATGVPGAFKIEAYFETNDPLSDENSIHALFAESRLPGREFFRMSLDTAIKATRKITGKLPIESSIPLEIPESTWLHEAAWWRCDRCSREFHSLSGWCTQCGNASHLMNWGK